LEIVNPLEGTPPGSAGRFTWVKVPGAELVPPGTVNPPGSVTVTGVVPGAAEIVNVVDATAAAAGGRPG
jgi:hypothetical protein